MEGGLKGLFKALALNDLATFQKSIRSVKFDELSHEVYSDLSRLMVKAYKDHQFVDQSFNSSLCGKLKNNKFSDFPSKISVFTSISELIPDYLPTAIQNFEEFLKNYHPLELSSTFSLQILKVLYKNLYFSTEIIAFIEESIILSILPAGKLSQDISTYLLWIYAENYYINEKIWEIMNFQVFPYKFRRFSYQNRIKIVHAMSLMKNLEISEYILDLFYSINIKELDLVTFLEFYMVINNLKVFKGISPRFSTENNLEIMEKYEKNKENGRINRTTTSKIQLEVGKYLTELGENYESEYCIQHPYLIFVDLFIKPNLVIEVQGPSHYLKPGFQESAKTVAKAELLKKLGFATEAVNCMTWKLLNEDNKKNLLRQMLDRNR